MLGAEGSLPFTLERADHSDGCFELYIKSFELVFAE